MDHDTRAEGDDAPLVDAARRGDADAFAALMRRHNPVLFRAARSVLGDDADLDDVVQTAWIKAHAALGSFAGASRFSTWAVRIAINEALMRLRRRKRTVTLPDDDVVIEPAVDADRSPEARAAGAEMVRVVEAALDRLSPAYRTVFVLREVQGLSTAETAEVLALSNEAVKTRLSRARGALRELVVEQLGPAASEAYAFDGARCARVVAHVLAVLASPR